MVTEELVEQSYNPPSNTQFSVFLDNKVGRLLDLLEVFDGKKLRLVALSVVDAADHAVVRMVTTNPDLVRQTLNYNKLAFSETEILVVELSHAHTLHQLCVALLSAEINIHYAYPLMVRPHGTPTIALHCDDQYMAGQILLKKQFTVLGDGDLFVNGEDENPI